MYKPMIVASSSSSYKMTATAFSLAFMASSAASAALEEKPQQQLATDKSYVEQIAQASYGGFQEIIAIDENTVNRELFEVSGEVFAKLANQSSQLDSDVASVVYDNFWDLCEA